MILSLLLSWFTIFIIMGRKHEEDNHEPNTVFVTVLEASRSNYFAVRCINTNSEKLCAGKQGRVVWEKKLQNQSSLDKVFRKGLTEEVAPTCCALKGKEEATF